jgi:biotin carboxyl carrier protein
LELHRSGDACRFRYRRADGSIVEGEASAIEVEPGIFSILWDGESYEAKLGGHFVDVAGEHFAVSVRDPRELAADASGDIAAGPAAIRAPMPGKVIRVLVELEQAVEAGQGVIVVEAMKMQNEMRAPKSGVVKAVQVQPGDGVSAGQVLAIIE